LIESRLPGLLSNSARDRLRAALDVLMELAEMDAVPLATTPQKTTVIGADESAQLNRVLDLLHKRFAEPIQMQDLCAVGNMSERSLHRLFVRHVGENVTGYLGRLRIGRACMSLVETDRPISVIASDTGFPNLSNFYRRFRAVRQMSPKEFRRQYRKHRSMPELDDFCAYGAAVIARKAKRRDWIPQARFLFFPNKTDHAVTARRLYISHSMVGQAISSPAAQLLATMASLRAAQKHGLIP
jgi:AraC-like DNA-binding protein